MHSRALLTAILFGSAIAGTRLLAQAPQIEPQSPRTGPDAARLRVGAFDQRRGTAEPRGLRSL